MLVAVTENHGYRWYSSNGVYFKGYIIDHELESCLRGVDAINRLKRFDSFDEFVAFLKIVDGDFLIIIDRKECTWAAADASHSMRIYYSSDGTMISDNAELLREKMNLSEKDIDKCALEECLYSAYVTFSRTLYKQIRQIDAGQAIEIANGRIETTCYYQHINEIQQIDREEALKLFDRVSSEVFDETLNAIDDRPIVLSLSGGYDSRYIACWLKEKGAKNVSCYTYGRKDSFEVAASKKIAEALGYRWGFVEYTDSLIKKTLEKDYIPYYDLYTGLDSAYYIQNYPAVKVLHEQEWFEKDSVFLTGLSNDLPAGSHVTGAYKRSNIEISVEGIVNNYIRLKTFNRHMVSDSLKQYHEELASIVNGIEKPVADYQSFVSASDVIKMLDRSCFCLHMNDVHSFFGYEWMLPCWNTKLLDFWYSMPVEYRVNQNLFEEWITQGIPAKYGLGEKKTIVGYSATKGWERQKARMRLILKRCLCYPLGIRLWEELDFNNFGLLAVDWYHRIHQKHLIGFRNLDLNYIGAIYFLEKQLGKNFYRELIERSE